ncbi:glycoside hydrolase family 3 N-terminal domain-containing protein [uncultured Sphingomonas sp.]|uniref:glycoside hydrolase family 3 N-terminal domain-containing protein n=1 Tax=uncultured Sphingomonas sp. TaxID=158754 RepID=UPI0025E994F1|nr:glycoside hydrolase family 3 N-terminal domain-containing protein [uncultured Sphingomonas sp.]
MSVSRRAVLGGSAALAAAAFAAPPSERDRKRTADLLSKLTLEEKVGQMNQVAGGRQKALNSRLDDAMMARVRAGEIGSFLHVAGAEPTRKVQMVALKESRLGIPLIFGIDVIHGYRTIFPAPLAMAASFDPAVHEAAARIAASETAVSGLHWTFTPMCDVARDPRWGRVVEGAGEDPWLGARMAEAQVKGFEQGPDPVLSCTKHFGAYGFVMGGRDYDSADISDRTLNEVVLPPYYAAITAGSGSAMTAFNDLGGVPTTGNAALVRGTLRNAWNFQGLVVSDWNAVRELMAHGIASSPQEAAALAVRASVDMDMAGGIYAEGLANAVRADPSLMPLVDEAVTRILNVKARLGLFDNPFRFGDLRREKVELNSAKHRKAARDACAKSLVLLKNKGSLLPLRKGAKVALIGGLAEDRSTFVGSWRARGQDQDAITLRAALADERLVTTTYVPGADSRNPDTSGIAAAAEAARAADVVLLVLGEDYDYSAESRSRSDLSLPGVQDQLADAVLAAGKPVVLLLIGGRPLALEGLAGKVGAILECWLPGVEGGPAIADILTGRIAPAGRLPMSMPRNAGMSPTFYNHLPTGRPASPDLAVDTARYHDADIGPLFPFGHGLSYASFDYGPLTVDKAEIGPGESVTVTVAVTNRGNMVADEVVQLYMRDPLASVARPVKEMRGVKRVTLRPGETKRVSFRLSAAQTAIWQAGRWHIEAGRIDLMVGASSDDIRQRGAFTITAEGWGSVPSASLSTPVMVS